MDYKNISRYKIYMLSMIVSHDVYNLDAKIFSYRQ